MCHNALRCCDTHLGTPMLSWEPYAVLSPPSPNLMSSFTKEFHTPSSVMGPSPMATEKENEWALVQRWGSKFCETHHWIHTLCPDGSRFNLWHFQERLWKILDNYCHYHYSELDRWIVLTWPLNVALYVYMLISPLPSAGYFTKHSFLPGACPSCKKSIIEMARPNAIKFPIAGRKQRS